MNTCNICGAPVDADAEPETTCSICGETVCSNCEVGGFCLECLSRLEIVPSGTHTD